MSAGEESGSSMKMIRRENGKTEVHDLILRDLDKAITYNDRVIEYLRRESKIAEARADDLEVDAYVTGNRPKIMRALEEAKRVQSEIMDALLDAQNAQIQVKDAKILRLKEIQTQLGIPCEGKS